MTTKNLLTILILVIIYGCAQTINKDSYNLSIESDKLIRESKYQEALIKINKAISIDKNNHLAYHNLGVVSIKLNYPKEQVVKAFTKSIELKPDFDVGIFSLANYHFDVKDYSQAVYFCNNYLKLPSEQRTLNEKFDAMIYLIRGESNRHQENYKSALSDLNKSIEIDSTIAEAYKERATIYRIFKATDKAVIDCEKAIRLSPDYSQAYNELGLCHTDLQEYDKAITDYSRAILINSTDAICYFNRGLVYYHIGKTDAAKADFYNADLLKHPKAKEFLKLLN